MGNYRSTLCWDCANAVCGCSWSRKLTPVEGWTAKETTLYYSTEDHNYETHSYRVTACPQFVPDNNEERAERLLVSLRKMDIPAETKRKLRERIYAGELDTAQRLMDWAITHYLE